MTGTQKQRFTGDTANERPVANYEKTPISQEKMQREADYIRAQRLLESLFEKQLISLSEFNKITALNRESFSPMLAEIMP
jgi:hypothetical protein